ncbi:hypothetical protein BS47DRAFT_1249117, partial [Hydnum rufescens UP504]
RENITVLDTICADGTYLKPVVIFKAKQLSAGWVCNNPVKASYALISCTPKGWTENKLAVNYLK